MAWLNSAWQQQKNFWDLSFFSQSLSSQCFRFSSVRSSLEPDTQFLLKPSGKGLGFSKAAYSRSCMKNHWWLYLCILWGLLRIPSSGKVLSSPLWVSPGVFGVRSQQTELLPALSQILTAELEGVSFLPLLCGGMKR